MCHLEWDDDQGGGMWEQRYRESREQEACPFSLMDSCHGKAAGNWGKVRTWEPGEDERKAERRGKRGKNEKKREKREKP